MHLNSIAFLFLASLALPAPSSSAEITPLPNSIPHWNASSQMEIGKAKIVSADQLPTAMRQVTQNQVAQRAMGYEAVPEEVFIHGKNYTQRLKGSHEHSKINIKLSDISMSSLGSYVYEGFIPDGPTQAGPWTSVTRVFRRNDGIVLMLHEWDFVADGGGIIIVKEAMNTTVSGIPAQLSHKRSPSGQVLTELSWATESKYFVLSVWGDVQPRPSPTTIASSNLQGSTAPIYQEEISAIAEGLK